MNGRLESELKIEKGIDTRLLSAPPFVIEWNEYLKANGKSATTRKDYLYKILRFLRFVDDDVKNIKIEDVTSSSVIMYFSSLQTTDIKGETNYTSDSYRQTVWTCLNDFFGFLMEKKMTRENPLKYIERPKNRDLARIRSSRINLTFEDFQKILNSVEKGVGSHKAREFQLLTKQRDLCIMLIFMNTGIRKSALINLNVDNVDFDRRKLTLYDKGKKIQDFILNDTLIDMIAKWLNDRRVFFNIQDEGGALFVSRNGNRMSATAIDDIVKKYTKDALGIELSPHKLRGGLISILMNEKHDAEFVRKFIGHSNVSTTLRYVTTDNTEKQEGCDIMSRLVV